LGGPNCEVAAPLRGGPAEAVRRACFASFVFPDRSASRLGPGSVSLPLTRPASVPPIGYRRAVKTVVYLHGFASSPGGRKVALLRELLPAPEYRVVAPDLNVPSFEELDFDQMAERATAEARREKAAVVVGSSLGALVALEASRHGVEAPLVLIAPALGFGRRWIEKAPAGDPLMFFHHGAGRELTIHRQFFEQMANSDCDRDPPAVPVTVVMGVLDESVPFSGVQEVWKRWERTGRLTQPSRFVEIPDGDHSLVDAVGRIADEIRNAATRQG
jgi:pimeloyl-ACP methyl ester carboxylesterase